MFSTCAGDSINIDPVVPEKRPIKESGIQTESITTEVQSSQVPELKNARIQTDMEKRKASCVEFEQEALLQFLNRVTPTVCFYLEKNLSSHAFDRYRLLSDVDETSTTMVNSLTCSMVKDEFYCADISWNSTGTAVAVAYSKQKHEDWCEHDAAVAIWNLNRKDFSHEKPNTLIESEYCVTRVAFHPDLPAVLVAGKFNGEIVLWNIAKEDDMVMGQSKISVDAHRESITGLYWSKEHKTRLTSCSLDGKILVWKYDDKKHELYPIDGFIVLADQLSRVLGIKSTRPDAEVGVTCMSINSEDPSIFVIGTEGGGIFQCSFNAVMPVPYLSSSSLTLKFPVTVNFEKLNGHVCSVHFSPFVRNIFLSAGSDGELRIYSLLQPKPILKIQLPSSIQNAQWSPVRPLVIAAILGNGNLCMFDLLIDHSMPSEVFPLGNGKIQGTTVLFNAVDPQLVGMGLNNGSCEIWMLRSQLTTAESYELDQLKTLATGREMAHES